MSSSTEPTRTPPAEVPDPSVSPLDARPGSTVAADTKAVLSEQAVTDAPVPDLATGRASTGAAAQMNKVSPWGDRIFRGLSGTTAVILTAMVGFIFIYLLLMAIPALLKDKSNFLTSREWSPNPGDMHFGILDFLWTTLWSSFLALLIAVPLAIGISLFITQLAPKRLATPVAFVIDLLAAVPSVIFGLWGLKVLSPTLDPVRNVLVEALSWIPLFGPGLGTASGTVFVASLVLAIMILPIITAITRDVFAQTPRDHVEAAYALGATRWEMIKMAVLPYGRSGMISGAMLGLGRALGETVAVMIILSAPAPGSKFDPSMFAGGATFASKIALDAAEFDSVDKTGAYIAAALVLFVITFVVNAIARLIADRKVKS